MSLYETLMTWPRERLAKELQAQAHKNAALQRRVFQLEVELFWLNAAPPAPAVHRGFGRQLDRPRTPAELACWCHTCRPITMEDNRMVLCPICGNKRCPRANDHNNACTGSNEPGQPGSAYPRRPEPDGGA